MGPEIEKGEVGVVANEKIVVRKDYIRRLISGVRKQIDKDPEIIEARREYGSEIMSAKWLDAELLCLVIEHEILENDDVK